MTTEWRRTTTAVSALILLNLFTARSVFGNTFAATTTADSGPGSLREAIQNAAPGDTITININGTIVLSTGPLWIAKDMTIVGPGPQQLAIDGGHLSRVFTVGDVTPANVAISGLTVQNGSSETGGGIFNGGHLTLMNTVLSGNTALSHGGAIYSGMGTTLNVTRSVLTGNAAGNRGGGIYAVSSMLTLTETAVSSNSASVGGGINASDCTMTLRRSTVSDNSANGGYGGFGGGVASDGTYNISGTVDIIDSTFADNFAAYQAGGLFQATGFLTVNNSTFANNRCSGTYSGCTAGGIYNLLAVTQIANSTFAANVSLVGGSITSMYGTTTVKNSILAKGASSANCYSSRSLAITSQGHNLSDDLSCSSAFTEAGDLNDVPAGLSSDGLQDNGGRTQTIQLLATSPAVDSVPLEACIDAGGAFISDQRGVTRPQGAACDIGAFERVPPPYIAQIVQPIKGDGTSVFSANRGVVPVKFTLSDSGAPTCQLPAATISLARTAGAVVSPINESDYLLAADEGVNFHVDAASCEYVYNLGSKSLGAGTYAVSISIDRAVVGTGTFGIR